MIKKKKYIEYMPEAFLSFVLSCSFTNASDTYSIMNMITHNNKEII